MRKDTINFIVSSDYDLQTAKAMLKSGRYIYVIFMCHIAIEKMLKAISAEVTQEHPPKTHNLIYLLKLAGIQIPEELFDFVAKINNASIVTRYPENFSKLIEVYPEDIAKKYFINTQKVIAWLKRHKTLQG